MGLPSKLNDTAHGEPVALQEYAGIPRDELLHLLMRVGPSAVNDLLIKCIATARDVFNSEMGALTETTEPSTYETSPLECSRPSPPMCMQGLTREPGALSAACSQRQNSCMAVFNPRRMRNMATRNARRPAGCPLARPWRCPSTHAVQQGLPKWVTQSREDLDQMLRRNQLAPHVLAVHSVTISQTSSGVKP